MQVIMMMIPIMKYQPQLIDFAFYCAYYIVALLLFILSCIFHLANSGLEFSVTGHDYQDDTSLTDSGLEDNFFHERKQIHNDRKLL